MLYVRAQDVPLDIATAVDTAVDGSADPDVGKIRYYEHASGLYLLWLEVVPALNKP